MGMPIYMSKFLSSLFLFSPPLLSLQTSLAISFNVGFRLAGVSSLDGYGGIRCSKSAEWEIDTSEDIGWTISWSLPERANCRECLRGGGGYSLWQQGPRATRPPLATNEALRLCALSTIDLLAAPGAVDIQFYRRPG